MGFGDFTRINTNVQSLRAYTSLQQTNEKLGMHQLRLATGNRINSSEDDSAGYSISKKLEAKTRGQAQALSNIGDAKGMLTVGEGSLNTVMNILQAMKEKSIQAANDSLGASERAAIQNNVDALRAEVDDILTGSEFNGTNLFTTAGVDFDFQVGAENGDSFNVAIDGLDVDDLLGTVTTTAAAATLDAGGDLSGTEVVDIAYTGAADQNYEFQVVADGANSKLQYRLAGGTTWTDSEVLGTTGSAPGADVAVTIGDLSFTIDTSYTNTNGETFEISALAESNSGGLVLDSHTNASAAIATVDTAITTLSEQLATLGDAQNRLTFKLENLQTSMTNYEAARSRIVDADFAREQMQIVKLQILQQTGTAALAQANAAPQSVLSLF